MAIWYSLWSFSTYIFFRCTKKIWQPCSSPVRENAGHPGTDVMILKIFSPKNSAKKLAFLTQTKAKFCKILIMTLVFEKNAHFLPKILKNRRKL
jgi:hypothetical protein